MAPLRTISFRLKALGLPLPALAPWVRGDQTRTGRVIAKHLGHGRFNVIR